MIPVSDVAFLGKEVEYVNRALADRQLSQGWFVEELERRFAAAVGAQHAVAVSSGTTALTLMLRAAGIGPGKRVAVPTLTYIATANAVRYTGAEVVLTDVDPGTWNMRPNHLDMQRIDAALPVHLFGNPVDFTGQTSIPVFYDAAEAVGARVEDIPVGRFGEASAYSLYANKIITTGEGGMITTDNADLAARARHLRGMATIARYVHDDVGYNFRMTNMQGAVGLAQVETLNEHLDRRYDIEDFYHAWLPKDVTLQQRSGGAVPWVMPILLPIDCSTARVRRQLANAGIETRPFFSPLHRQTPYYDATMSYATNAEHIVERGLLLPLHVHMDADDVRYICTTLKGLL